MIYIPSKLLRSAPFDFSTTYQPTSCPPQVAQNVKELQDLRNNFYQTFEGIGSKGDHELVEQLDWLPLLSYMNRTPELIEYAVYNANFPLQMRWESGAYPGSEHSVCDDNEVAATTELLFSRILGSWGTMSSTRGHIASLRVAASQSNGFKIKEVIKGCLDRVLFACVRMYKLNYSSNLIYPGLKNRAGPLECTKDYALTSYLLLELNLSSLMIEKTLAADMIGDKHVQLVCGMCAIALGKIVTIRSSFENFNCPQTAEVAQYCIAAECYFDTMMLFSIFRLNKMMEEGGAEKTKDIETLYVENNILANHLFDCKDRISDMIPKMTNKFVGADNLQHTLNHFDASIVGAMKKSIGTYDAVKDSLDKTRFKFYDIKSIKASIFAGEDSVHSYIQTSAAIDEN